MQIQKMGLLGQNFSLKLIILCSLQILVCNLSSCQIQDKRDLKIFLPENFSGWGAIIFEGKEKCTKDNQTIMVQTDSLGIGYAKMGDCFPHSGIQHHYFFYMRKGNDYIRINSLFNGRNCEEADTLQGREAYYNNGGKFTGYNNEYDILVFHIGKCDDPKELFRIDVESPGLKQLRTNYEKYIESINKTK